MNRLIVFMAMLCCGSFLYAQPYLVKDIYVGNEPGNPNGFKVYNGKVYFNAASEDTSLGTPGFPQYELWVSDGTDTGTKMVHDLTFDVGGSADPSSLVVANGKLFYVGYAVGGGQLWMSDGTDDGTHVVITASYPDVFYSSPNNIISYKNNIYLRAVENGALASAIFKTDGTVPGTKRLSATATEPGGLTMSTEMGNYLYLFCGTSHPFGLTQTDGTAAGTKEIKQFKSPVNSNLVTYKNAVYFMSDSSSKSNFELWKSDGTTAGTVLVKEINPGNSPNLGIEQRMVANSKYLFFFANDGVHGEELWRTDGTTAGTTLVRDLKPGAGAFDITGLLLCVNDRILFTTGDASGVYFNLWESDGTEGGTWIIMDSLSTPLSMLNKSYDTTMNQLIFADFERLFITDGTPWGTKLIAECDMTHGMQYISELVYNNGMILMNVYDTTHQSELYRFDYTAKLPSGVNAPDKKAVVTIYPNPFNYSFSIQSSGMNIYYNFTMFDIAGKKVFEQKEIKADTEITPGGIEIGLYTYTFSDLNGLIYHGKLLHE